MANYLPVLLVSVAANSVPDDSSVATLPRAQVDYLSHNWEEEDVWRSWRNMTRQKNEIANGVRLENASWRTWWKQRNGLGTVTPETVNWLKDSDVTWLYGPLHTAAGDWAPPPKPAPSPGLDLTTHKPILKHRSISQLLTSDFTSPVFSPLETDNDASYFAHPSLHVPHEPDGSSKPRRPVLSHTKSDTHIPNRAFRKVSPPRIHPPAEPYSPPAIRTPEGYSSSNNHSSDSTTPAPSRPHGQKKRHISFNTFVEQCIAIDKPNKRSGYAEDDEDDDDDDQVDEADEDDYIHRSVAGRYPYGRNAWGYDDGYEEDAEEESDEDTEAASLSMWDDRFRGNRIQSGSDSDSYEDGVGEEDGQADEDEGDGVTDMRSYSLTKPNSPRSQSTASTASSSSSASTSTSLSNSTSPTSESPDRLNPEKQPSNRRPSTSSTSTYRPRFHPSSGSRKRRNAPPLIRTPTSERGRAASPTSQSTHVTIAPIAPTILKTGTHGYYGHHHGGWSEGFGDEGGSDDGIWGGASRWWSEKGKRKASEEGESSGGQTPVELVYVPPFGSNYNFRKEREQKISVKEREREREQNGAKLVNGDVMEDHEDGFGNGDQDVYRRRATLFSVGDDDVGVDADDADAIVTSSRGVHRSAPVPTVVIRPDVQSHGHTDVGDDFRSRRSSSSSLSLGRSASIDLYRGRGTLQTSSAAREEAMNDRERSRSKSRSRSRSRSHSRSHSRTPSPAMITDLSGDRPQVPASSVSDSSPRHTHVPVLIPRRSSSSSLFPSSAGSLLSPPPRSGRGSQSYQDVGSAQQQQQQQRGRSATRTGSSISRERSAGSTSLGSLSPEGWDLGGVASAYAGGRYEKDRDRDKDRRDRDRDRDRPRGRERGEIKRFGPAQGHSVSPEGVQDSLLRVSPASTMMPPVLPSPPELEASRLNVVTPKTKASASSSSSRSSNSSTTVSPLNIAVVAGYEAIPLAIPVAIPIDVRTAEEHQRNIQPTPSNSPVIQLRPATAAADPKSASNQDSDRFSSQPHLTPTATYTPKIKSPLVVPAVSPAEPSTSYSISPPRSELSPPSSPRSPTSNEPTIVAKAVEMVSSAGAFLGLWNYSA